ncbi:hypothetical protein TNCV_1830851 [Trichonephila clavipes]|nr:hypothetical protein TNCV_1830851 [Trichonephila clavipes]
MDKEDIETEPTLDEMFEEVSVLLHCPTVSSEESVAIEDDNNVCRTPILWQTKTFWEFVKPQKIVLIPILTTEMR